MPFHALAVELHLQIEFTIPIKPVDLELVVTALEESTSKNIENLNKPILTIAPSSIAATIAFVGATAKTLEFGIWQSTFLLACWLFWLLSIASILLVYLLKAIALEKPLQMAKQFNQLDFDSVNMESIENSVLRNRGMFEPNNKLVKWGTKFQIAAPALFCFGFVSVFLFLVVSFLFKAQSLTQ